MRWRPNPSFRFDHPYLLLCLTTLFWAGNWIVGRAFRDDVPPIALSFWRWLVAFACVIPFAWQDLLRHRTLIRENWRILMLLGGLGTALYNALTYIGLQYTTATNGVLLNSFIPVAIIGIGWIFLGKRMNLAEVLGVALSFVGVTIIVARGNFSTLAELSLNIGDLWILASVLGWATYTVCLQWRPAGLPPLAMLASLIMAGLLVMAPAYLIELVVLDRHINPSPAALAGIVYTGIFPAFLGYIFWNRAVAEVGSNQAGIFIHLMPVFGIILSSLFLGEHPQGFHFAGIAAIFSGIALTMRFRPRTA